MAPKYRRAHSISRIKRAEDLIVDDFRLPSDPGLFTVQLMNYQSTSFGSSSARAQFLAADERERNANLDYGMDL